jgi:hypothetical protein
MTNDPCMTTNPASRPAARAARLRANAGVLPNDMRRLSHRKSVVLAVVEGVHDIEFLRRISRVLHQDDPRVIDLGLLEGEGRLIFIPQGGGDLACWAHRLGPLQQPEFHLYDRETGSTTALRMRTSDVINRRPACRAFVTTKRTLENYLHPVCLREARGVEIVFGDCDDVATITARRIWDGVGKPIAWFDLPPRARYRLRAKAKCWLNTEAVMQMNRQRLAERDPDGEVVSWLASIADMSSRC